MGQAGWLGNVDCFVALSLLYNIRNTSFIFVHRTRYSFSKFAGKRVRHFLHRPPKGFHQGRVWKHGEKALRAGPPVFGFVLAAVTRYFSTASDGIYVKVGRSPARQTQQPRSSTTESTVVSEHGLRDGRVLVPSQSCQEEVLHRVTADLYLPL